ncbi:MAG: zf-TFIIB domain-containing protein [Myxococcota bacterium]
MNCPVCRTSSLRRVSLDDGLPALACSSCGGHWLGAADYHAWRGRTGDAPLPATNTSGEVQVSDVQGVKVCPECRRLMVRYRVGRGVDFRLDQCGACSGMWFDRNEWEALRQQGLHLQLNLIFTEPWQDRARRDESRKVMEGIYLKRFGDDYEEVKRMRQWLQAHPERMSILAFLMDDDPYSGSR